MISDGLCVARDIDLRMEKYAHSARNIYDAARSI